LADISETEFPNFEPKDQPIQVSLRLFRFQWENIHFPIETQINQYKIIFHFAQI